MKKAIKEHINFIENSLKKEDVNFDWRILSDFNRIQIGFFQQERLVHLLITLFFGLIFLGSILAELLILDTDNNLIFSFPGLLIVNIILLIMLVSYILHYFFLENSVQKLYQLEKEIEKRSQGMIQ